MANMFGFESLSDLFDAASRRQLAQQQFREQRDNDAAHNQLAQAQFQEQQQNNAIQRQTAQAQLGQLLYNQNRERTLSSLVQQNPGAYSDPMAQAYAGAGFGQEANQAQQAAIARQEQAAKLLQIHSDIARSQAAGVKNADQYSQWVGRMAPDVKAMYGLPDEYDPDVVKSFVASGITPEKQAELKAKQDALEKGRYGFSTPDPLTGAMYKIDHLTGETTLVHGSGAAAAPAAATSAREAKTEPGKAAPPSEPVYVDTPAPPGSKIATYKRELLDPLAADLDTTKGRSDLDVLKQKQIDAGERLEALINSPGPFTMQRVHEAATMAATIANGGNVPAMTQIEEQTPKTFRGNSSEWWQKVANKPVDVDMGPFIAQMRQQSERENALAKQQIRQALLKRLVKHPDAFQLFPASAHRMAEGAGLKGLYDTKTLLPLKGKAAEIGHYKNQLQPGERLFMNDSGQAKAIGEDEEAPEGFEEVE